MLTSPAKDNTYTRAYFASIISLNAFKRELITSRLLSVISQYRWTVETNFYEQEMKEIFVKLLDLVHPCFSTNINNNANENIIENVLNNEYKAVFRIASPSTSEPDKPLLAIAIK